MSLLFVPSCSSCPSLSLDTAYIASVEHRTHEAKTIHQISFHYTGKMLNLGINASVMLLAIRNQHSGL